MTKIGLCGSQRLSRYQPYQIELSVKKRCCTGGWYTLWLGSATRSVVFPSTIPVLSHTHDERDVEKDTDMESGQKVEEENNAHQRGDHVVYIDLNEEQTSLHTFDNIDYNRKENFTFDRLRTYLTATLEDYHTEYKDEPQSDVYQDLKQTYQNGFRMAITPPKGQKPQKLLEEVQAHAMKPIKKEALLEDVVLSSARAQASSKRKQTEGYIETSNPTPSMRHSRHQASGNE